MPRQNLLSVDKVQDGQTMDLRLQADYTNLGAREAFRELVQNWRDQCVNQGDILEAQIRDCIKKEVITNGVSRAIIFRFFAPPSARVRSPQRTRCLGFIRYLGTHGSGTVELVNYASTLQPWNLHMGGSTKRNDGRSVGTHGEGLNIAALALLRSRVNYGIRCFSGGLEWNIDLTVEGTLGVSWKKIDHMPEGVSSLQSPGELTTDPERDLCFIIGEAGRMGNDENGEQINRVAISEDAFLAWLHTTLFLQMVPPEQIYSTRHGELLVSHSSPGKLYLRGFQLSEPSAGSASLSGKPLKFSYNYYSGKANRERAHVADATEEAKLNSQIWDSVIKENHEMVHELHKMLMSKDPEYGDVHLQAIHSTPAMGVALLDHLKELHPGAWFFSETEARDGEIFRTIESFGLRPHPLPAQYHAILRKHGRINSAAEENRERLENARVIEPMEMPDEPFTQDLHRVLDHFNTFCPSMRNAEIEIVRCETIQTKLHCLNPKSNPKFKIHERWFSKTDIARDLGVELRDHSQAIHCVASLLESEMIEKLGIGSLRGSHGHEQRKTPWLVRRRQVEENQNLHIATSAKPVTIEPDKTIESGLVVNFEVPVGWRRDAAEPGTANVILQVHLDESCHRKRWFATNFSDNNRMSECSDLCEEIRGDGNMTEAVLSIRGSDQEFFAILGNSNDNKSIPLVSLGSAIPYQGPVDNRPGSPRASPAASTPLKRRLDTPESTKKRVKVEHDSSDEDDY